MVVRAKNEKNEAEIEKERMKIIKQGAPVVEEKEDSKKNWTNFTLRIKSEMLQEIDAALEDIAGLSKTGFILQAIQEKLRRKE